MLWVSLRAAPAAAVYLHGRYRHGQRTYPVDDPAATNVAREDTRTHWTASADLRVARRVLWSVYYTYETVTSSRPDRSFASHVVASGFSYQVW